MMTQEEIKSIAQSYNINLDNMSESDVVRAIQSAEGNEPCFGTARSETCGQDGCTWREGCLVAAIKPADTISEKDEEPETTKPEPLFSSLKEAVPLAFQYYASNDLSGAINICNQLLANKVEDFYVYYLSGIIAFQINDRALALSHLQAALNLYDGTLSGHAGRITDVTSRLQLLA